MKDEKQPCITIHCGNTMPPRPEPAGWIDSELSDWLRQVAPKAEQCPEGVALDGRIVFQGGLAVQRYALHELGVEVPWHLAVQMFGVAVVLMRLHNISEAESIGRCLASFVRVTAKTRASNAN
jgi:hypothetical protein